MLDFNRYTHLTFDCYGTLIDWERGILAALRPVLDRHGVDLPAEQVLALYGELESAAEHGPYRPYREVLGTVMDGFGERLGFRPAADERAALADSLGRWPPFPDTVEALRALAGRYSLAILSNVDDDLFARTAQQLQVRFAAVITAQQARSYKPALRNFRIALERLGAPADRVLHVAQSLFHDIAPASEVGLATVWVNRQGERPGSGATPPAMARPALEVPDLRTLAALASEEGAGQGR